MAILEHVGISTTNDKWAQTVEFYQTVFGMKVIRQIKDSQGRDIAFLSDGQGGRIEVMAYGEPALPGPSHLAFGVAQDQFDATVAKLQASGVKVDPPMPPGETRLCYFDDPAGNRAQIVARLNPLPI